MSFFRRYSSQPALGTLIQIEGTVAIDKTPPSTFAGVQTGVVAIVGEFADMTYGVAFDTTAGTFSSSPRPVQITGPIDLLEKLGGFDETLGEFGGDQGNGFVELVGKTFSTLVAVPVNLASLRGVRVTRQLPVCRTQTDVTPVLPMSPAVVDAGREFKNSSNRLRICARVVFTDTAAFKTGTDGSTSSAGPAVTNTITSATGDFQNVVRPDGTKGVKKGDILVYGYNNSGAIAPASEGGTYRVAADAGAATTLTVEKMDGSSFSVGNTSSVPYRIHLSATADSGGQYAAADAAGTSVPARPLDASFGSAKVVFTPTVAPTTPTGNVWEPLSGLGALGTSNAAGVVYTAATQAPNVVNSATVFALYETAIDSLLSTQSPSGNVNIVFSARKYDSIRTKLRSFALRASERGVGRRVCIAPELDTLTLTSAIGAATPGVGAYRNERVIYDWPGLRVFVKEAVGFSLKGADGNTYSDGIIDTGSDGWLASILSVLPPEHNPGEASDEVQAALSTVLGLQRGAPTLGIDEYITLKSYGICAPYSDPDEGMVFQSGVTSSLTAGETTINRRFMADFIQDSIARVHKKYVKKIQTQSWKDAIVGDTAAFLEGLLSQGNPEGQRIDGYEIDDVTGNTQAMIDNNVFALITRVKMLATGDVIVTTSEVGTSVKISSSIL